MTLLFEFMDAARLIIFQRQMLHFHNCKLSQVRRISVNFVYFTNRKLYTSEEDFYQYSNDLHASTSTLMNYHSVKYSLPSVPRKQRPAKPTIIPIYTKKLLQQARKQHEMRMKTIYKFIIVKIQERTADQTRPTLLAYHRLTTIFASAFQKLKWPQPKQHSNFPHNFPKE